MTFLYAPAIGHYVRMESASTDGEAPLVRRLVSFSRDTGTAVADAAKTDRTKSGWPADRLPSRPSPRPSPQRSPTAVPVVAPGDRKSGVSGKGGEARVELRESR